MKIIKKLKRAIEAKDYNKVAKLCEKLKAKCGPLVVNIFHDEDHDFHYGDGRWTPYSFSRRHSNFAQPEHLGLGDTLNENGKPDVEDEELKAKLDSGLAFFLSYFEHGNCIWEIASGEEGCQFDSVRCAGILIWENDESDMGATTFADRTKDAAGYLKDYTAWCNGEIYGFSIEDHDGPCCGGFFDLDEMFSEIKDIADGRPVTFEGDGAYLAKHHWPKHLPLEV